MERQLAPATISAMILSAPAWQRLALAVRNPRLRERAADAMAERIVEAFEDRSEPDPRQMALPIIG